MINLLFKYNDKVRSIGQIMKYLIDVFIIIWFTEFGLKHLHYKQMLKSTT